MRSISIEKPWDNHKTAYRNIILEISYIVFVCFGCWVYIRVLPPDPDVDPLQVRDHSDDGDIPHFGPRANDSVKVRTLAVNGET